MPGAPTVNELRALSPADFFVQWQQACHRMTFVPRAVGWIAGLFRKERGEQASPTVVGAVLEGDDLAHIVYRRSGLMHPWERRTLTVRRDGDRWGLMLSRYGGLSDPFREGEAWLMMRRVAPRFFWAALKSWRPWRR